VFHLDITKVNLVLHILQWDTSVVSLVVAVGPACIRVGVEGARAAGTGNDASTNRDVARVDTHRRGKWRSTSPPGEAGVGVRTGTAACLCRAVDKR
jgi:hypothetical protein